MPSSIAGEQAVVGGASWANELPDCRGDDGIALGASGTEESLSSAKTAVGGGRGEVGLITT